MIGLGSDNNVFFQLERLPEDEQYFIHSADIADRVKVIFDFYVTSDLSEVTSSIFTKNKPSFIHF